jgi:hypothetical protein
MTIFHDSPLKPFAAYPSNALKATQFRRSCGVDRLLTPNCLLTSADAAQSFDILNRVLFKIFNTVPMEDPSPFGTPTYCIPLY